jgi:hypothetical protein
LKNREVTCARRQENDNPRDPKMIHPFTYIFTSSFLSRQPLHITINLICWQMPANNSIAALAIVTVAAWFDVYGYHSISPILGIINILVFSLFLFGDLSVSDLTTICFQFLGCRFVDDNFPGVSRCPFRTFNNASC